MKQYKYLTFEEKLACIKLYAEEAKKDEDSDIRREAELYFNVIENKEELTLAEVCKELGREVKIIK